MVWLGVCSEGITPLVILEKETVNHKVYIKNVLPVVRKYGNQVFGDIFLVLTFFFYINY